MWCSLEELKAGMTFYWGSKGVNHCSVILHTEEKLWEMVKNPELHTAMLWRTPHLHLLKDPSALSCNVSHSSNWKRLYKYEITAAAQLLNPPVSVNNKQQEDWESKHRSVSHQTLSWLWAGVFSVCCSNKGIGTINNMNLCLKTASVRLC